MSAALATKRYTPEEYLELEVRADRKHEYYRGEIFMMPGGSPEHSFTKVNLYRIVGNFLVGKPCVLFDSDLRVNCLKSFPHPPPVTTVAASSTCIASSLRSRNTS